MNGWFGVAAVFAFLSVALGAFGAHVLSETISSGAMITYQKGTKYMMFHSIALFICSFGISLLPEEKLLHKAAFLFLGGIIIFSGSLFIIAITGIRSLGLLTPFGGILQLSGWVLLAIIGFKRRK